MYIVLYVELIYSIKLFLLQELATLANISCRDMFVYFVEMQVGQAGTLTSDRYISGGGYEGLVYFHSFVFYIMLWFYVLAEVAVVVFTF